MASAAADLPVDLLEDIFLRLDDAADLVRTSAACASFGRIVSNDRFLRRFRSVHRPPVLGLLRRRGLCFHPAEPPSRSAQAARSIARAAGFSSSFLPADPTEHYLYVHDAHDGRVLLSQSSLLVYDNDVATCLSLSNLVVYDPLYRKHVQIPPIPNDLIVACTCTDEHQFCCCDLGYESIPFLVPAAVGDEDDLSFQVMCTMLSADCNMLKTFIYSVTEKWCGLAPLRDVCCKPVHCLFSMIRHYAHGCFYWVDCCEKDMLKLDLNEMKFSLVHLPHGTNSEFKIIVEAAEEDRIWLVGSS